METLELTAGDIRDLLIEAEMPPRAKRWPEPGFAIVNGDTYQPHPDSGAMVVNGRPRFSAAWR